MKPEKPRLSILMALELPSHPNFLRLQGMKDHAIPIETLSDKELRQLGKKWTEALIEHAKTRRNA